MAIQIRDGEKVIHEFQSDLEILTLINLICHAKFCDGGMRYEYLQSETANTLIDALNSYLSEKHQGDAFLGHKYPSPLSDGGKLKSQIIDVIQHWNKANGKPDIATEDVEFAMYPWSSE